MIVIYDNRLFKKILKKAIHTDPTSSLETLKFALENSRVEKTPVREIQVDPWYAWKMVNQC